MLLRVDAFWHSFTLAVDSLNGWLETELHKIHGPSFEHMPLSIFPGTLPRNKSLIIHSMPL